MSYLEEAAHMHLPHARRTVRPCRLRFPMDRSWCRALHGMGDEKPLPCSGCEMGRRTGPACSRGELRLGRAIHR